MFFEKIGVFEILRMNNLIEFIKRHYRNYGIRRLQLQEEISSLFYLPMKSWGSGGSNSRARTTRQIQPRMDPTHSADSVVRKRKSQIHRFVST